MPLPAIITLYALASIGVITICYLAYLFVLYAWERSDTKRHYYLKAMLLELCADLKKVISEDEPSVEAEWVIEQFTRKIRTREVHLLSELKQNLADKKNQNSQDNDELIANFLANPEIR